jgi:hypothetical protein
MQETLEKNEGSPVGARSGPDHMTSPVQGSYPDKKYSPFCPEYCIQASSQNLRNVPANVFNDKNGFLWRCCRPECPDAIWNLDRQYITGCRKLIDGYEHDHRIRADLDKLRMLTFFRKT